MAQAWGQTLQDLYAVATVGAGQPSSIGILLPHAGAVPTRDEIVAWYAQVSFVRWWQTVEGAVQNLPHGARLALGVLLSVAGLYLVFRSYQRVMRPTQADLVRRVANAAHSCTGPSSGIGGTGAASTSSHRAMRRPGRARCAA